MSENPRTVRTLRCFDECAVVGEAVPHVQSLLPMQEIAKRRILSNSTPHHSRIHGAHMSPCSLTNGHSCFALVRYCPFAINLAVPDRSYCVGLKNAKSQMEEADPLYLRAITVRRIPLGPESRCGRVTQQPGAVVQQLFTTCSSVLSITLPEHGPMALFTDPPGQVLGG